MENKVDSYTRAAGLRAHCGKAIELFTIGHSNRSLEDFLSLLREFKVQAVADIRRYPSSRKFPHFNRQPLHELLNGANIEYYWLQALGGRRFNNKGAGSPNTGLTSTGFRNYADYMLTAQFHTAVQQLLAIAATKQLAAMCAEKLYWKCHRRLLSDYLVAQGVKVKHILEAGKVSEHKLTSCAVITPDSVVAYPLRAHSDTNLKALFEV